jgi:hypothetical protein
MNIPSYTHGTFAMLKLSANSASSLMSWCRENNLPCIDDEYLHCTILYSRKPVDRLSDLNGLRMLISATIIGWERFGTALVLKLYSSQIDLLHSLMIGQGGTHDFPEYIAHVSITYDWQTNYLPELTPAMILEFDQMLIEPINPKYLPSG